VLVKGHDFQPFCPTLSDQLYIFHGSRVFWFGCSRQQKHHVAAAPPPARVRRRMERNRQKLVGRNKGSLTEQQTKGTATTTIQIRRKHNTNRTTRRAALPNCRCALPSCEWVPAPQLPPTGTQHDGTWYGMPGSVWPGGVSLPDCAPSWSPVKINPVLAEPRTQIFIDVKVFNRNRKTILYNLYFY